MGFVLNIRKLDKLGRVSVSKLLNVCFYHKISRNIKVNHAVHLICGLKSKMNKRLTQ